jgi:hypothetical protein
MRIACQYVFTRESTLPTTVIFGFFHLETEAIVGRFGNKNHAELEESVADFFPKLEAFVADVEI